MDGFIRKQRDRFTRLGQVVEWKHYGHDLPDRLRFAGFAPEDAETVMIGQAVSLAKAVDLPPGVELREVGSRSDLERIRAMEEAVWGIDHSWLPDALEQEMRGSGDPCAVVVAEVGGDVVCAAWVRFHEGTDFASFWGGSTIENWRGNGIYRALAAYRAALAVSRGFRYVQVDASSDSKPILARLGLLAVATTTPYVWDGRTVNETFAWR
ncbi:GNAT family N-acetyltransferase [Streptomyces cacaoi]